MIIQVATYLYNEAIDKQFKSADAGGGGSCEKIVLTNPNEASRGNDPTESEEDDIRALRDQLRERRRRKRRQHRDRFIMLGSSTIYINDCV